VIFTEGIELDGKRDYGVLVGGGVETNEVDYPLLFTPVTVEMTLPFGRVLCWVVN
jgi:hypothetical protein